MALPQPKKAMSLGEKLQALGKHQLYLLLIVVCSVPLFFALPVPNKPDKATIDLFQRISAVPKDGVVLVQSDWTNSTRGENGGNMEALVRLLMRRDIKFVLYSGADPQAPQVARNVIARINEERAAKGMRRYVRWDDYVDLGYLPDMGTMAIAMASDLRKAWGQQRDSRPGEEPRGVFQSPVLKNVRKIEDVDLVINVHASGTHIVLIQRFGEKVPIASMCTGVMVPEMVPYYRSGQIIGYSGGLKGVYDLEMLMDNGVNWTNPDGKIVVKDASVPVIEGFPGDFPMGRGKAYYPTLHAALTLLILAVVVGNLGLYLTRKKSGRSA